MKKHCKRLGLGLVFLAGLAICGAVVVYAPVVVGGIYLLCIVYVFGCLADDILNLDDDDCYYGY